MPPAATVPPAAGPARGTVLAYAADLPHDGWGVAGDPGRADRVKDGRSQARR